MKFFASKRTQRLTNFALAAMLVVSTLTASVPFLFAQKAKADAGYNVRVTPECVNNLVTLNILGNNPDNGQPPVWVKSSANFQLSSPVLAQPGVNDIAVPLATGQGNIPAGGVTMYISSTQDGQYTLLDDPSAMASYSAIDCNDYSVVYVNEVTGNDANAGITANAPLKTIQQAVNKVNVNGTVNVAAGTYTEAVTVAKAVTINGANSGVDARSRSGAETIVNATDANFNFNVTASNVTIDGFTFNSPASDSAAIKLFGGSGYHINNNIINNSSRAVVFNASNVKLYRNVVNNANSATYISGFEENSAAANNVVIESNKFVGGSKNADINFIGVAVTTSNGVVVKSNTSTNGISFLGITNTTGAMITNNTITGAQQQRGIFVGGNNHGTQINNNVISTPYVYGAGVIVINPFGYGLNSDIKGTGNNFAGSTNGVVVDNGTLAPNGNGLAAGETADFSMNWWGNASGPSDLVSTDGSVPASHAGTGVSVYGAVKYAPWYTNAAMTSLSETVAPTVINSSQTYQAVGANGQVAVTLTFSEAIDPTTIGQGWYPVAGSGQTKFTKVYYSTKTDIVSFADLNGNVGSYTLTVDKTAPTVTNFAQAYENKEGGRVNVTLTFSEPINPTTIGQGWNAIAGTNNTQFKKAYYSSKSYTVTFTDVVGNPGSYTFTVDATAPNVTSVTGVNENQSVNHAVTLRVNVTEPSSMTYAYTIEHDGQTTGNGTLPAGSQTITLPEVSGEGIYKVTVTIKDATGNPTTVIRNFTIDKTAPSATFQFPSVGSLATSFKVKFTEPVLKAEAENAANYFLNNWSGAPSFASLAGNANVSYDANTMTATVSFTTPGWYVSPEQQWGVKNVHDLAGNVIAETTAYSTPLTSPTTPGTPTTTTPAKSLTNTWTWTAATDLPTPAEDASGIKGYEYALTAHDVAATTWTFTTDTSATTTAPSDGTYDLHVRALDKAGSAAGPESVGTVLIDTTAPVPTITSPENGTTVGNNAKVTIAGSVAEANGYTYTLSIGKTGQAPVKEVTGSNFASYTWDTTGVASDNYIATLTATDTAGNPSEVNAAIVITVDNTAPNVVIAPQTNTDGNQPTITGTVNDATATLLVTFNGADYAVANNNGTFSFTAPTALANGTYSFAIAATDVNGNQSTRAANVVVAVVPPATTPATTVTPIITSPASAVLGATTDNTNTGDAGVKGTSDDKTASAVDSDANKGTIFGLAWYWWILILAALAAIAWFIIAAIRRRNEEQA